MSLILCLSPAYQPLLCGLVGRDMCVPHFVSLTGVPAFIVRSCRERRVCPSFCVSHRRTSPLCGLVGRDVCVPHFVSLTGVPALCAVLQGETCVFLILCLSPAYQPFVQSCRERRVCPFFHIFCVTQSHLRINQPLLFYVGRVIFITLR